MPTVLLCVSGMRDAADEQRVQQALEAELGVFGAVASRRSECVDVDYEDDEVRVDRLLEIVESAGFRAVLGG